MLALAHCSKTCHSLHQHNCICTEILNTIQMHSITLTVLLLHVTIVVTLIMYEKEKVKTGNFTDDNQSSGHFIRYTFTYLQCILQQLRCKLKILNVSTLGVLEYRRHYANVPWNNMTWTALECTNVLNKMATKHILHYTREFNQKNTSSHEYSNTTIWTFNTVSSTNLKKSNKIKIEIYNKILIPRTLF